MKYYERITQAGDRYIATRKDGDFRDFHCYSEAEKWLKEEEIMRRCFIDEFFQIRNAVKSERSL